jgi:guanylate kinase
MSNKIIIITAPSGSGKSSIAKGLMQAMPNMQFSISAATRKPRSGEIDGEHYHFISVAEFESKIKNKEFAEWEKVYEGKYYGTLCSEMNRIWSQSQIPLLDIDVQGAINIQKAYPAQTLSLFIQVPLSELKKRLIARGTETSESLQERLSKADQEAQQSIYFNHIIINDQLDKAIKETIELVKNFLEN